MPYMEIGNLHCSLTTWYTCAHVFLCTFSLKIFCKIVKTKKNHTKSYSIHIALLHLYKWLCLFISSMFTHVSLLTIHAPFGTVGWNNRVNAIMYVNVYVCKIYRGRQASAALLVPGHNAPVHGQSAWVLVSEFTLTYDRLTSMPTCKCSWSLGFMYIHELQVSASLSKVQKYTWTCICTLHKYKWTS